MATACITHSALQVHGISKPIIAKFDQPHASSDGGAILLKAIDDRLGLTWRLANAIHDRRQPGKVAHPLRDLLRQRVFGLACGYADCNDAARLIDDPIHKLLLDRDPIEGAGLGSQPTLSRFENAVACTDLYRLGTTLADAMLTHHRERLGDTVRLITIDLDATDDPTHGQQEFALFNGYYDTWCYLPLIATVTFNTEPIQHVIAALLRPGTGAATRGVRGLLRRLFSKLRTLFPGARLRVRADAGFADAKLLAFLDAAEVEYVLGLAGNRRLDTRVRRLLGRARMQARSTKGHGDIVRRDALRGAPLGAQAAHHHEGRGALLSRPVAQGQSAVSGHESAASAGHGVHALVLRPRRHGEPAQRTAARGRHGPHELLALRRQSAPAVVLRRGLCPVPDMADLRAPHRSRRRAGRHAARATREGGGVGRTVGAAHRVAPASSLPVARDVGRTRSSADGHLTWRPPTTVLAPGRRLSPALVTRARAQASRPTAGGTIAGSLPGAIVSGCERSIPRPLEPFWSSVSAFTNSPG